MKKIFNIILALACVLACAGVMTSCSLGSTCASHTDIDSNGLCDVCGTAYTCSGHADVNADGMCDFCLASFSCTFHYDQDADLKCDSCKAPFVCSGHADVDGDSACDNCFAPFSCTAHRDVNYDGKCDVCLADYVCPGHEDVDIDSKCDICKAPFACVAHKDSDGDSKCDYCKADFECVGHVDAGSDGRCDRCDALYTCPGHKDSNGDNKCDVCLGYYKTPVDFRADFAEAAASTDPEKLIVKVITSEIGKGTLESVFTVTYNADGSFVIEATVQKFNTSFTGDLILTENVTITCDANGNYSDGGEFVGQNPVATGLAIDFSKLVTYSTPNATLLNATVLKANTEAVFGVAYNADVTLTVNKDDAQITTVALSYANITITCEYK